MAQVSATTGVNQSNLSQYESGSKTPTLALLYRLARAYGVNVCDLLPKHSDTNAGGELGHGPIPDANPAVKPETARPATDLSKRKHKPLKISANRGVAPTKPSPAPPPGPGAGQKRKRGPNKPLPPA